MTFDYLDFGRQWGASASKAVALVASASFSVIIGVVVFLAFFFTMLVQDDRAGRWLEENAPIDRDAVRRLAGAFYQTGRGMLIGSGLTALAQGIVATAMYAALGIPRAALLGILTVGFSLIPLTGPALVWIPVAAGLVLNGHIGKAALLAVLGIFVVGTVDNVLRPWLSRRASLGLTSVTALVAILGGVAAFGAWGILFGPLAVRLALEGLEIARARGAFGRPPPSQELRPEGSS
jgi:predicted PurR-regulated permease PerM